MKVSVEYPKSKARSPLSRFLAFSLECNHKRILNIASTGTYISCPHNIVNTATKSYLLSFTKGLAAE